MFPKIYLAIDNCFASKRWTRPGEWMAIVRDLGVRCVEASADNECDPLYCGDEYLADWVKDVRRASEETGVAVCNLYSGHGTYATLGLAHTDPRVRERILHQWIKPMCSAAGEVGAGLGFFAHAFAEAILQDPRRCADAREQLFDSLAEVARFYAEVGEKTVGVEQMYTPHQVPWTLAGCEELLAEVTRRAGRPFYVSLDTGHQSGQRRFLRPGVEQIAAAIGEARETGDRTPPWLGPVEAYRLFDEAVRQPDDDPDVAAGRILEVQERYPYLFAEHRDGDTYAWLERLAPYSPIVHLQQTDGMRSAHWPFTAEFNSQGIIHGEKVLQAIHQAYRKTPCDAMPPRVEEIYLTIEVFSGTAQLRPDILRNLRQTVEYWRAFVPEDGLAVDELVSRLER